jgi:epoxyqueuosine reductase
MMAGMDAYEKLRKLALSGGASLFGVADLDRIRADTDLLDSSYDRYSRGISIGVELDVDVLAGIVDGPTHEYVCEYLKANGLLDSIAQALTDKLRSMGAGALRIPASEVVDWEKLRGHLSHKLIGRYAGHGWIGKTILLIHPDLGARVRYATVLTDAVLNADAPIEENCGTCARCIVACPAQAATDDPSRFNLNACFNKLVEFNERLDEPHFICGICIKMCRGKNSRTRS